MPQTNRIYATDPEATEVLDGLRSLPKRIAPKYFYDERGATLFDAITELDEYYLTRTEAEIFKAHRDEICAVIGANANVVEPGAGSCEKIRWLLPELAPQTYTPMDISAAHLKQSANRLGAEFPDLAISPQVCDHTDGMHIDNIGAPLVFFYPGSSIGNFEPADAAQFMQEMRAAIKSTGGLLIGVDAKKDRGVLDAAYNDHAGVTAEFNLNVLDHLNTLFGGTLDRNYFEHVAFYNSAAGRVEMHLRCRNTHQARLAGCQFKFAADELVHTENSYKYSPAEFAALARQAGFRQQSIWQDVRGWYSLFYFEPV